MRRCAENSSRQGIQSIRFPDEAKQALYWEDLLTFRHHGGLAGHAEMSGKTLFLKSNTGPSGHGAPVAAGEAMALKLAGASDVRVFAIDGEGGLTTGVTHETQNSAWGLGLDNLYYLVDWNDYGIDNHASKFRGLRNTGRVVRCPWVAGIWDGTRHGMANSDQNDARDDLD